MHGKINQHPQRSFLLESNEISITKFNLLFSILILFKINNKILKNKLFVHSRRMAWDNSGRINMGYLSRFELIANWFPHATTMNGFEAPVVGLD